MICLTGFNIFIYFAHCLSFQARRCFQKRKKEMIPSLQLDYSSVLTPGMFATDRLWTCLTCNVQFALGRRKEAADKDRTQQADNGLKLPAKATQADGDGATPHAADIDAENILRLREMGIDKVVSCASRSQTPARLELLVPVGYMPVGYMPVGFSSLHLGGDTLAFHSLAVAYSKSRHISPCRDNDNLVQWKCANFGKAKCSWRATKVCTIKSHSCRFKRRKRKYIIACRSRLWNSCGGGGRQSSMSQPCDVRRQKNLHSKSQSAHRLTRPL